jgi:hypothetical protein
VYNVNSIIVKLANKVHNSIHNALSVNLDMKRILQLDNASKSIANRMESISITRMELILSATTVHLAVVSVSITILACNAKPTLF